MKLEILYEDRDLLVVNKPPFLSVFPGGKKKGKTLIDLLLKDFSQLKKLGKENRYGVVHRLDKETSGVLLVAKNKRTLDFLQGQFKERKVKKKYLALVTGNITPKKGEVEVFLARDFKNRKKQRVYSLLEPKAKGKKLRKAITSYKAIKEFKDFTLLEISPKTGRKHQIRTTFAYLLHPLAGDKLYKFKSQKTPEGLKRLFLHTSSLRIKLPSGKEKEFKSNLPEDLQKVLKNLK